MKKIGPLLAALLKGTSTNDNAVAGYVGEFMESEVLVGSAVSLTSTVAADVTSLSLTAGDWMVFGNVVFNINAATVINNVQGWIHSVSATGPTRPAKGSQALMWFGSTAAGPTIQQLPVGMRRVSLASTTTYYLGVSSNFTTNTCAAYGYMGAWRVR